MIGRNEGEHRYECGHGPRDEKKTFYDGQQGALFEDNTNFTPTELKKKIRKNSYMLFWSAVYVSFQK